MRDLSCEVPRGGNGVSSAQRLVDLRSRIRGFQDQLDRMKAGEPLRHFVLSRLRRAEEELRVQTDRSSEQAAR